MFITITITAVTKSADGALREAADFFTPLSAEVHGVRVNVMSRTVARKAQFICVDLYANRNISNSFYGISTASNNQR